MISEYLKQRALKLGKSARASMEGVRDVNDFLDRCANPNVRQLPSHVFGHCMTCNENCWECELTAAFLDGAGFGDMVSQYQQQQSQEASNAATER